MADKTERVLSSLKARPQVQQPIATEMFIPNHSGILGSQQAKNDLDGRYLGATSSQTQPVRALNTIYQNTTGGNMTVYGSVQVTWADDNFPGDTAYATCLTGATSPPTTTRQTIGAIIVYNSIALPNMAARHNFSFYFVVPNNHYYEITSTVSGSAGIVTLSEWNEINLTTPPT